MTLRSALLLPALASVLVAGACSSPSGDDGRRPDGPDEGVRKVERAVAGLGGQRRVERLRELARREGGRLELYTSLSPGLVNDVVGAFEDEHGIDVALYRASDETVAQRLEEEAKAGFRGADAVETNGDTMTALDDRGRLAAFPVEAAAANGPRSRRGAWVVSRFNRILVSANTRLVSRGEEPRSWRELAEPRWRGKLALEATESSWYFALRGHLERSGMSREDAERVFEGIARNATIVKGHSLLDELVASGEFAVGVADYGHLVRRAGDEGAPVREVEAVRPVVTRAHGSAIVRRARHPAAAALWLEWLAGEGQATVREVMLDPARRPKSASGEELEIDLEAFARARDEAEARFEELTRLGKAGPQEG